MSYISQDAIHLRELYKKLDYSEIAIMDVPTVPAFRTAFQTFHDSNERNPSLPSYFRTTELVDEWLPIETSTGIGHYKSLKSSHGLDSSSDDSPKQGSNVLRGIVMLQNIFRRNSARQLLMQTYRATILIQSMTRKLLLRKDYIVIRRDVIRCQAVARRYLAQKRKSLQEKNDPHTVRMREMRMELFEVQKRLKIIEEERIEIAKEKERRKNEIRIEVEQRILGEYQINHQLIQSGKEVIDYLQNENKTLRSSMKDLRYKTVSLHAANESLERANRIAGVYSHELKRHVKKFRNTNGILRKAVTNIKNVYKPKWRSALIERKVYGKAEAKQKFLYRQCLTRIIDHALKESNCDQLTTSLSQIVDNCESEFEHALDIETPIDLFPPPLDSDSLFDYLTDEGDDDELSFDDYDEESLEWIDDSNANLIDCVQLNADASLLLLADNNQDSSESSSTGPSSIWNSSDSDASTASSSDGSDDSTSDSSSSNSEESPSETSAPDSDVLASTKVSSHFINTEFEQSARKGPPDACTVKGYPQEVVINVKNDTDSKMLKGPVDSFTTCSTEMESDCISNVSSEFSFLGNTTTGEYELDLVDIFPALDKPAGDQTDAVSEYITVISNDDSSFEVESISKTNSKSGQYRKLIQAPFRHRDPTKTRHDQKRNTHRPPTIRRSLPYIPELPKKGTSKENSFSKPRQPQKFHRTRNTSMRSVSNHPLRENPPSFTRRQSRPPSVPNKTRSMSKKNPATRSNSLFSTTRRVPRSVVVSVTPKPRSMPNINAVPPFKARPAPRRKPPKIPVRDRNPSRLRSIPTKAQPRFIN